MRCSPYSSSVNNTNHVVNIVSASKSVNVPYQSGKSTLPNVSLSIRKKHPSKLQLKSITFQILQNLLFQWRVIVWMNTHVGLELDGRGVFLGRHFSSLNRPFGDPGRSLMCATSLTQIINPLMIKASSTQNGGQMLLLKRTFVLPQDCVGSPQTSGIQVIKI